MPPTRCGHNACGMISNNFGSYMPFTFVEPPEGCATPIPPANNLIESWNARIRDMLRRHRGLSLVRQIKAVCWWCHQHTGTPKPDAWLAANAVTDEQIEAFYREAWEHSPLGAWQTTGIPMR